MAALRLLLLGPLDISDEGGSSRLEGGPILRRLLGALAVQRNKVVLDHSLIDSAWGEHPPPSADRTLRAYVSRLRRALAEPSARVRLARAKAGYVLECDPGSTDVDDAEALIANARQLGEAEAPLAVSLLARAEALWRGPSLADVADEPFAIGEARRLDELRMLVTELRVEAEIAAGMLGEAVASLELLTARHPDRERLWRSKMVALHQLGRTAEALRAFQELRHHLRRSAGLSPSQATLDLERRILRDDDWASTTKVTSAPAIHVHASARRVSRCEQAPAIEVIRHAHGPCDLVVKVGGVVVEVHPNLEITGRGWTRRVNDASTWIRLDDAPPP